MRNREKIKALTDKMSELLEEGPMLPGSISEQWNVCGKKEYRCRDKVSPKRHGPYPQLSFTLGGRGSSMFIKIKDLEKAREYTLRYREFKGLFGELLQAHVKEVREYGFTDEATEEKEK